MEVGNGRMSSFEVPEQEGNAVKHKSRGHGEQGDFSQHFPQENDEEEILEGPQSIEDDASVEEPDVHRTDPFLSPRGPKLMISRFHGNFEPVPGTGRSQASLGILITFPMGDFSEKGGLTRDIERAEIPLLPFLRQPVKLPIHGEIKKGVNPGTLDDALIDGREGENPLPCPPHSPFQLLGRNQRGLEDGIERIVLLPIPGQNSPLPLQSLEGIRPRTGSHDEGEGPVQLVSDDEIGDLIEDRLVVPIQAYDKCPHDTDSVVVNPLHCLFVSLGFVEALFHRGQIPRGEGFEAEVQGDTSAF